MEVRKERAYLQSVSMRFQHGFEGLGDKERKVNWGPLTGGYECQVAVCRTFNSYLFGTILSPNLCWSQGIIKRYQSRVYCLGERANMKPHNWITRHWLMRYAPSSGARRWRRAVLTVSKPRHRPDSTQTSRES